MWHVTARMAWHDSGWNGTVCNEPALNTYCTGSHSLLSERLAREKCVTVESKHVGQKLDASLPEYLPPCFWSSCAFAEGETEIVHRHPFARYKQQMQISDALPPNSVYTWPFRLSITQDSYRQFGQYFPDLEQRIDRYCERLKIGHSLIFLYLNYDNPVSADEYRYALAGCAKLSDLKKTGHFDFDATELQKIRSNDGMQNFPTLNWAIRLSHEGGGSAVRLPYQEYLAHISENPDDEQKLEEIRILIDEPALLPGFKYVSEQINHDHALVLLYKLKRAFAAAREHGIVDIGDAEDVVDQHIRNLWALRGLYPGLGAVVSVLQDLAEGELRKENPSGQQFVDCLHRKIQSEDLLNTVFELLGSTDPLPPELSEHRSTVRDARAGFEDHSHLTAVLRKLSLFALTSRQVGRIIYPEHDGPHAFGGRSITETEIARNPYLLAESYRPATDQWRESVADLDREQRTDGPIDYFTIDVGMFPDQLYIERSDGLQNLTVAGPQRLRSFAIEALNRHQEFGHSFASLDALVEDARKHPLFYKDRIALSATQFLSDKHLSHFRERLHVQTVDGKHFFYLQETKDAEEIVARFVGERIDFPDRDFDVTWLDDYLDGQAEEIAGKIFNFDSEKFKKERRRLVEGGLQRPFFCVTGRPGSGKTHAIQAVLKHLDKAGETATVLAPTGKAALRLNDAASATALWKTETIDRWIYRSGLASYLDGGVSLKMMTRSQHYERTDNIVIDEMSMVDLPHLALVFRALEVHQQGTIKRVILVGDENQLPPIGCGRPFHDIIAHLREDRDREQRSLVRLLSNCRQQQDDTVLKAAHLFAGKNRYHTDLFDELLLGGDISPYLSVRYWKNADELQYQVEKFLTQVLSEAEHGTGVLSSEQQFNRLLGLYESGHVPKANAQKLSLDRAQLLTPYRAGPSGALGLSEFVRDHYRRAVWPGKYESMFAHSDKIIRLTNHYVYNRKEKRRELHLSNGSIGVVCNNASGRRAYFPECARPLIWDRLDEKDFELAYAITIHKAQGSEFQELLVVIPERRALLSRELVYTALTRSKTRLTVLVQRSPRLNPLQVARDRSVLLLRNSSIFCAPFDSRRVFEPESGVKVKSKIEYMIYSELRKSREAGALTFAYEKKITLPINGKKVTVKPDFTVWCGGKTYYWEHLGMLDRADYSRNWKVRLSGYVEMGEGENLVTTDDLGGVKQENLSRVVAALINNTLSGDSSTEYSLHHYEL